MAFNFTGGTETRKRSTALVVVLLIVSLVCTGVYIREGESGPLHTVQNWFSAFAAPAKYASGAISSVEDNTARGLANAQADDVTLLGLRDQNEQMRQTIAQLEEYRQEAQRLQGLLDIKDLYDADTITARVLSRNLDPWNLVVTLDKGADQGVRAGLPVMGPTGLVGQVIATTSTTSEMRLLQDPQSGVSVIIQSSRVEGIVRGSLDGLLYLEDVDNDAEVKVGDVVITSGLGGGYFQGILVGTVSKVEGDVGTASRRIVIDPNAQALPFEEVMVVTAMRAGATTSSTPDGQVANAEAGNSENASNQDSTEESYDDSYEEYDTYSEGY